VLWEMGPARPRPPGILDSDEAVEGGEVEERTCVFPKRMSFMVAAGQAYGFREMRCECPASLSMPLTDAAGPLAVRMEEVRGSGSDPATSARRCRRGRQPGERSGDSVSGVGAAPPARGRPLGGLPCRW
jgi:hypothetical protein